MASEVPESLLRLEEPLLMSAPARSNNEAEAEQESKDYGAGAQVTSTKTSSGNVQTDEIVNSVLPPRTFTKKDQSKWMQYTSKEPATRLEVIQVQEELDRKLAERQARDSGICPVREDLYRQAFDEIIRQVTLNQPERGLLLLRTRDEARMTVDAYKTLYDSSIVFGIRKQLQAEQGMSDMEAEIKQLEEDCKARENEVLEFRNRVEIMEKREAEIKAISEKKRKEEIAFLKYQGQNLDKFLKSVSGSA
ncbi:Axonemal dynein light intermediate polypeptide 1 [Hondaea fermentalgiana]|uniref:Axonemal dynein light intermediate polypeptide 1 n=1 Tax=Hondaea fermentalgiana TaxID=2315210 RepID=A0A2R5GVY2_9STRA|nr:Axonemal dynein light intermediate polypeptide 1 [Hondaea fermentalgiana]|eukprot:GBG32571.1 Axonemal dynein light intermediate polypeptide 1 [Hondaea fermentalgiana]